MLTVRGVSRAALACTGRRRSDWQPAARWTHSASGKDADAEQKATSRPARAGIESFPDLQRIVTRVHNYSDLRKVMPMLNDLGSHELPSSPTEVFQCFRGHLAFTDLQCLQLGIWMRNRGIADHKNWAEFCKILERMPLASYRTWSLLCVTCAKLGHAERASYYCKRIFDSVGSGAKDGTIATKVRWTKLLPALFRVIGYGTPLYEDWFERVCELKSLAVFQGVLETHAFLGNAEGFAATRNAAAQADVGYDSDAADALYHKLALHLSTPVPSSQIGAMARALRAAVEEEGGEASGAVFERYPPLENLVRGASLDTGAKRDLFRVLSRKRSSSSGRPPGEGEADRPTLCYSFKVGTCTDVECPDVHQLVKCAAGAECAAARCAFIHPDEIAFRWAADGVRTAEPAGVPAEPKSDSPPSAPPGQPSESPAVDGRSVVELLSSTVRSARPRPWEPENGDTQNAPVEAAGPALSPGRSSTRPAPPVIPRSSQATDSQPDAPDTEPTPPGAEEKKGPRRPAAPPPRGNRPKPAQPPPPPPKPGGGKSRRDEVPPGPRPGDDELFLSSVRRFRNARLPPPPEPAHAAGHEAEELARSRLRAVLADLQAMVKRPPPEAKRGFGRRLPPPSPELLATYERKPVFTPAAGKAARGTSAHRDSASARLLAAVQRSDSRGTGAGEAGQDHPAPPPRLPAFSIERGSSAALSLLAVVTDATSRAPAACQQGPAAPARPLFQSMHQQHRKPAIDANETAWFAELSSIMKQSG
ncbi:hypothetical protein DIPPA_20719 [Diplonema papillatum]|nr:hypothetical protein DIPPA_20719 [Diplonema papillatum]